MDKAVLESLAAGLPVVVLNRTFSDLLGNKKEFLLEAADPAELAAKILAAKSRLADLEAIQINIKNNYSLEALVGRIVSAIG
jgi:glycosyltransferase involved in cell wall biosynthesis